MTWLAVPEENLTAQDVMAKAIQVHKKRLAAYPALSPTRRMDEFKAPPKEPGRGHLPYKGIFVYPILHEVAKQVGVNPEILKGGKDSTKTIPIAQYRMLAAALATRLTNKSLPAIGRSMDLDHTSILNAKKKIAPLVDACGMTRDHSLREWVAACLPYLFAYIEQMRVEMRAQMAPLHEDIICHTCAPPSLNER